MLAGDSTFWTDDQRHLLAGDDMATKATKPLDQWDWPVTRRETGLIEHLCPHGIGHPNPGSARWVAEGFGMDNDHTDDEIDANESAWLVHGCDGCCSHDSFPGYREALVHAHGIIRDQHRRLREYRDAVDFAVGLVDEIENPTTTEALLAERLEEV